jgi:hypothetical protein
MEARCIDGTRAHILILPLEFLWKIFELLDYPSTLFRTATCQTIRFSPTISMFRQISASAEFIHVAENIFRHHEGGRFGRFYRTAVKPSPSENNVAWPPSCYICGNDMDCRFRIANGKVRWTCFIRRRFDRPFC